MRGGSEWKKGLFGFQNSFLLLVPGRVVLKIEIDEGKHCSWMVLSERKLRAVKIRYLNEIAANVEIQDLSFQLIVQMVKQH